ncbi:hypothetical protein BSL82_03430 [Tardibacter chloracetimidivorans]|uniref:Uncharacterized protein n=1 Tax=Tardibacter chloracetimidivorans TaxID=1921510 RepID=A0A1L3ZS67_9SPHN|nr:hypothetical protein BSL82_03430 [Tardibacter chloracetimidivorans]
MQDPYQRERRTDMDAASSSIFLITPHDTNEITKGVKGLRIWNPEATAGTVALRAIGDGADVSLTIPAGALVQEPVRAQYIRDTGTGDTLVIHGYSDN